MRVKLTSIVAMLLISCACWSQVNMKLPAVTVEELEESSYPLDPEADAAILVDLGTALTNQSRVVISHHRIQRIKIYTKEGLSWADWTLGLHKSENQMENLVGFKAYVYNLEKGKVVKQKLGRKALIRDKFDDDFQTFKLAFPKVREGSIIEVDYTIESNYLFDFSWAFQKSIPVKHSEFSAGLHTYYKFNFLLRNYFPHTVVGPNHWRFKDVPAFKNETYITSPRDVIASISFNMVRAQFPGQAEPIFEINSWGETKKLIRESWERYRYGHKRIKDYVANNFGQVPLNREGMQTIYTKLRKDFSWNKYARLFQSSSFNDILDSKTGSSADLNLLLHEILKEKGFKTQLYITSTVNYGKAKYDIPVLDKFNYVLNRVVVDGMPVWVDLVSDQDSYNRPPTRLLGVDALEMNNAEKPTWRKVETNRTAMERSAVDISFNVEEELINVKYDLVAGDYLKSDLSELEQEEIMKKLGLDSTDDYELDSVTVKRHENSIEPLSISCQYTKPQELIGDLIIFNPLLVEEKIESPFGKGKDRKYPIHFRHKTNTSYSAVITIPEGYVVDKMPESRSISLPAGMGQFQYISQNSDGKVQVRLKYQINKVDIEPGYFPALVEFYQKVTESIAESIVFKRG